MSASHNSIRPDHMGGAVIREARALFGTGLYPTRRHGAVREVLPAVDGLNAGLRVASEDDEVSDFAIQIPSIGLSVTRGAAPAPLCGPSRPRDGSAVAKTHILYPQIARNFVNIPVWSRGILGGLVAGGLMLLIEPWSTPREAFLVVMRPVIILGVTFFFIAMGQNPKKL